MAIYRVSSVTGDNSDGTTWAKAFTSVTAALAAATGTGPHSIWVSNAHNHTATAAILWNAATTGATINIISVTPSGADSHSGWTAGAIESVGAAAAAFSIGSTAISQFLNIFGCTINSGTTANAGCDVNIATQGGAVVIEVNIDSCALNVNNTNSGAIMLLGAAAGGGRRVTINNSSIKTKDNATAATHPIVFQGGTFVFNNITHVFGGASKSVFLFGFLSSSTQSEIIISNSDLSGYDASGGFYFDASLAANSRIKLVNCKLSGTPGINSATWEDHFSSISLINCDSGDTHNVFEYRTKAGTLTENTSIYNDAGAKFDGSRLSWQVVTTAACSEQDPFILPWVHRWADETSSITVAFEMAYDNATKLTNRTAWPQVEYVSDASFPKGTLANGRFATPYEGTAANWADSSDTWTGTGGFSNPQKSTIAPAAFTPAERSTIRGRLLIGIASWTGYVDPAMRITGHAASPNARWIEGSAFIAEPGGGIPRSRLVNKQ